MKKLIGRKFQLLIFSQCAKTFANMLIDINTVVTKREVEVARV